MQSRKKRKNNHNIFSHMIFIEIILGVSGLLFYKYSLILFEELPMASYTQSANVFIYVVIVCAAFGTFLSIKSSRRDFAGILTSSSFGVGLYSCIAFYKSFRRIFLPIFILTGIVLILYLIRFLISPITNIKYRKEIITKRFFRAATGTFRIVGYSLIIILAVIWVRQKNHLTFVQSDMLFYDSIGPQIDDFAKSKDNLQMILVDKNWQRLSPEKKMAILTFFGEYEIAKLNIEEPISFRICPLSENTKGMHSSTGIIKLDYSSALKDTFWESFEVICHELYHAYQTQLANIYLSLDESLQNDLAFSNLAVYAFEINHYQSDINDYDSYYNQRLESDARFYAETECEDVWIYLYVKWAQFEEDSLESN